jgi:spermidine/putrescine transport system permease protein
MLGTQLIDGRRQDGADGRDPRPRLRDMAPGAGFPLMRFLTWPGVIFTALFFALPLIAMIVVSFWQRTSEGIVAEWTLENYAKFFEKDFLVAALYNSIEVTLITTAISVVVAYPLAYVLAYRVTGRWQRILLLVTVLPFWTAYVVRSYSWLLVISEGGVLNDLLRSVGVIETPLELAYTRGATVLGFVHFFTMLLTLTIFANLVQISPSYRKAATDLGASAFSVFWRITLPLSIPGVAVGAFLTFVVTIGDYVTPQILGGNAELLVPQAIMLQLSRSANFPMASAMGTLLMAIVILVYLGMAKRLKMERL